jgi:hypothetical protein
MQFSGKRHGHGQPIYFPALFASTEGCCGGPHGHVGTGNTAPRDLRIYFGTLSYYAPSKCLPLPSTCQQGTCLLAATLPATIPRQFLMCISIGRRCRSSRAARRCRCRRGRTPMVSCCSSRRSTLPFLILDNISPPRVGGVWPRYGTFPGYDQGADGHNVSWL